MSEPFRGLPADTFRFYAELVANNNRDWWAENRWRYDETIRPAFEGLLDSLHYSWWPLPIYRPYRDVRFRAPEVPYKSAIGASAAELTGVMHYVQAGIGYTDRNGLFVSRGMYRMSYDQLQRYRVAVDADEGGVLQAAVDEVAAAGLRVGGQDIVTYAPKGYPRDHPRAELLRLGGINASAWWPPEHGWLSTRRVLMMIQDSWNAAKPLTDWLAAHVGPPEVD